MKSTGHLTAIEMAAVNIVFIVLLTLFQNQGNTVTKGALVYKIRTVDISRVRLG